MPNSSKSEARIRRAEEAVEQQLPLRFVSAASLFDGHDAAINIIRRLLQSHGAEVVHLGHNRSVADIVRAAIQEDADGIAVSSYQGGHNEYFRYMVDMLREFGAGHIRVFVGGGGTIAPQEVQELHDYGIERIYTPEDGRALGLDGMIEDVLGRARTGERPDFEFGPLGPADHQQIARTISLLEQGRSTQSLRETLGKAAGRSRPRAPVIGITGTGGAGKSSLTDELLLRFLREFPDRNVAVVAMDPTRRRSGGALLGDRIRMNSLSSPQVFMRSLATRRQNLATSEVLADVLNLLRYAGFDLVVVETAGIGQSDTEIVDLVDLPIYVMTSEYGAASQLEKIDMLDFAELIALNKFEKRGAEDALRDVRKQWRRNRRDFERPDAELPVFPTIASRFNDPGVNRLFAAICERLEAEHAARPGQWQVTDPGPIELRERTALIPPERTRYLAEIAANGRRAQEDLQHRAVAATRAQGLYEALRTLEDPLLPDPLKPYPDSALADAADPARATLRDAYNDALEAVGPEGLALLRQWPALAQSVTDERYRYVVRGREIAGDNYSETLSHNAVPKIAAPRYRDWGELLTFLLKENLPGHFPYTAGVYPYRREEEDPTRMFAGEGGPERTNRRFHYVAGGHGAARLSTAFDSTTLYGEDPDERPDIYGRIGNSGVSIATLDDMKRLYSGFDLCAPTTSVSMTINGPAPMILAMFMNTAVDQRVERHLRESGRWEAAERRIAELYADRERPVYRGELPEGHDGFGLGLLGVTGDRLVDAETYAKLRAEALALVRGTVQADILKEDQAQNT
jgi:methylmalonyl-CoA mutase